MSEPTLQSYPPGRVLTMHGRKYEVIRVLSVELLAADVSTRALRTLRVQLARRASRLARSEPGRGSRERATAGKREAAEARRRFAAIKPLLEAARPTRAQATRLAAAAGVHTSTLYGWLHTFRGSGQMASLIPRKRGPKAGTTTLSATTEAIVQAAIEDVYLNQPPARPQHVVNRVLSRCKAAGVPAPHPNTVRNRLQRLRPRT
jgi:putative transposase